MKRNSWLHLPGRPKHSVVVYGKPGCHLCEDVLARLQRLTRWRRVTIEEIDITRDERLFRRYDIRIPVIVVDGGAEFDAPFSDQTLERLLT